MKLKYISIALLASLLAIVLIAACGEPVIPPPSMPVNLAVIAVTDSAVSLSWSSVSSAAVKEQYNIYVSETATFVTPVVASYLGAYNPSAIVTGLNPNTTYFFKVQATNTGGSSGACAPVAGTTASSNTWANLSVTGMSDLSVGLSCNAFPGAVRYLYFQSSAIDGTYTSSTTNGVTTGAGTIDTIVSGLNPSTTYYFKVMAVDNMKNGPLSMPIAGTTAATGATPVQGRDAFLQDYSEGMATITAAISANPLLTPGTRTYQASGANGGNVFLNLTKTFNSSTLASTTTENIWWSGYRGTHGAVINNFFIINDTGVSGTLNFDYGLKPGTVVFKGTNTGGSISGTYTISYSGANYPYNLATGLPY